MHSHTPRKSVGFALGLVALLALVGILSVPQVAAAPLGPPGWSAPLTVAASSYSNGYSAVVTDSKGYTYVFYESQNPNNLAVVYLNVTRYYDHYPYSIFTPTPVRPQGTWTVNATNQRPTYGVPPSAAIDPATGTLYVAWERSAAVSGSSTIIVSSSTTKGESWSSAVAHTLTSVNANDTYPALAVASNGQLAVAFMESWNTGIFSAVDSIAAVRSPDGGSTFTPAVNVSTGSITFFSGTLFQPPSIVADSHGRMYLAFSDGTFNLFPTSYSTFASWSDGDAWSTPAMLNPNSTWALNPTVAVDGSGGVHVTWLDFRMVGGQPSVHARASTDRGLTWGADGLVMRSVAPSNVNAVPVLASFADTLEVTMIPSPSSGIFQFTWSQDDGTTWGSVGGLVTGPVTPGALHSSSGGNNTYWVTYMDTSTASGGVYLSYWEAPPSTPMITSVASAASSLVVHWTPSPETDIAYFQVSRSIAGSGAWTVVADVASPATSYTDSGLADGTYAYQIVAVDSSGVGSNPSAAVAGTVGVTIAQLENEIANLQNQIAALKGTANANNQTLAQLESELANLQNQLSTLQGQQATQTMSYVNLGFEILVVVLLAVILLMQLRRPKNPVQVLAPTPGQAVKSNPEDEL